MAYEHRYFQISGQPILERAVQSCTAALSESDKGKLPKRIAEAEKAVVLRARELFQAAADNGEETAVRDDVMYFLHALQSKYQNLGVS
jgi:hypothetical protein